MNSINKILAIVLLITYSILQSNCQDEIAADKLRKQNGRRDYVWIIDTIKNNQLESVNLISIWGDNKNDVWAVGLSSSSKYSVWHYNGIKWDYYPGSFGSNMFSVFGISSDNVWATDATAGDIYHFNGIEWYKHTTLSSSERPSVAGVSMSGNSSDKIFLVGAQYHNSIPQNAGSMIAKYNGRDWTILPINVNKVTFYKIKISNSTNQKFIAGVLQTPQGDTNKIYIFNEDFEHAKEIYSTKEAVSINSINGEVYFSIGKRICKYDNGNITPLINLSSTSYIGLAYGRTERDIFTQSSYGVGHFNGDDFETIFTTNNLIVDMILFDSEIYILTQSDKYSIILKGTLKKE